MQRVIKQLAALFLTVALEPGPLAAPPQKLEYPKIQGNGGVFRVSGEPELPRQGSKVVLDVTSGTEEDGVNRGFSRAARFVNLFALGGVEDFRAAVVLHGAATKEALSDEAYAKLFGKPNPNRAVVTQLRKAGVEILVCGQALTHAGYNTAQVDAEIKVALSAATAIINRQMQGYAYLSIP
jgi:intracellular sulfur oxidation DsrE/DsrF family protein